MEPKAAFISPATWRKDRIVQKSLLGLLLPVFGYLEQGGEPGGDTEFEVVSKE